jgi:Zn-dependent peptidase ImmA (M78 family)
VRKSVSVTRICPPPGLRLESIPDEHRTFVQPVLNAAGAGAPTREITIRKTDLAAQRLLAEANIDAAPIDVMLLAKLAGAEVVRHQFDDGDISGMLYRDDTQTVIGINSSHSLTRQRSTVAHELGHLKLHPGRSLILDAPARVNFRDPTASLATDREEIEANAFAAAILMPERLVLESVSQLLTAGQHTPKKLALLLAEEYAVSTAAMGYRLINLGITT